MFDEVRCRSGNVIGTLARSRTLDVAIFGIPSARLGDFIGRLSEKRYLSILQLQGLRVSGLHRIVKGLRASDNPLRLCAITERGLGIGIGGGVFWRVEIQHRAGREPRSVGPRQVPRLTETDEPDTFPHNHEHDKCEKDPGYDGMCVKAVLVVHVAETEPVQLGGIAPSCGVDRK